MFQNVKISEIQIPKTRSLTKTHARKGRGRRLTSNTQRLRTGKKNTVTLPYRQLFNLCYNQSGI